MRHFFFLLSAVLCACGGNLNVGDGPGQDGGTGSRSCSMSDCSAYKITCTTGQPTSLQCTYDSTISGCSLTGQCTDSTATQTCTYTPPPQNCSNGQPCSNIGGIGGGGEVDLASDPTTATTTLTINLADMTSQTYGDCAFYPYGFATPGYAVGQPLPNVGTVTATAPGFTLSASPLCDGSYVPASIGQLVDQGGVVSISWTGSSSYPNPNPAFPNIPGPHGLSVTEPGTLNASGTTLSRATDATLTWVFLQAPLSLEQVGFELVQSQKRLECRFPSSATTGTVPADALLQFGAGSATFRMFSVHAATTSSVNNTTLAVMREATFSDGAHVAGTLGLN